MRSEDIRQELQINNITDRTSYYGNKWCEHVKERKKIYFKERSELWFTRKEELSKIYENMDWAKKTVIGTEQVVEPNPSSRSPPPPPSTSRIRPHGLFQLRI
jgi:hypothetical protein